MVFGCMLAHKHTHDRIAIIFIYLLMFENRIELHMKWTTHTGAVCHLWCHAAVAAAVATPPFWTEASNTNQISFCIVWYNKQLLVWKNIGQDALFNFMAFLYTVDAHTVFDEVAHCIQMQTLWRVRASGDDDDKAIQAWRVVRTDSTIFDLIWSRARCKTPFVLYACVIIDGSIAAIHGISRSLSESGEISAPTNRKSQRCSTKDLNRPMQQ